MQGRQKKREAGYVDGQTEGNIETVRAQGWMEGHTDRNGQTEKAFSWEDRANE